MGIHRAQYALAMIALIAQVTSGIEGRTKLQKMVYLVNLSGWNCINDFKFHHYGPFSGTLAKELEGMKNNEWIRETARSTGNDRTLYMYRIPPRRRNIVNGIIARIHDQNLVRRTSGLVKQLDQFSSDELEIMSSLVYVRDSQPQLDDSSLVQIVQELKPRFTIDQIRRGLRVFNILRPLRA